MEWGRRGAQDAAKRGDILIVVDVLRFSTAVAAALWRGAAVYPCPETEDAQEVALRLGAKAAGHARAGALYSLSPSSFAKAPSGERIVLASLNGATCSRLAEEVPYLFVGALVNAQAVGEAVNRIMQSASHAVTVVACGERWGTPHPEGTLRFAIEDYLGAGAIFSYLSHSKSPEAQLSEIAFHGSLERLETMLLECGSGRELIARDQKEDILHANTLNRYPIAPCLREGWFLPAEA